MDSRMPLPLSTAQRGMWVGQQLAPAGAIFNIAEAIELNGSIDADLLERALQLVTQEMETIRVRILRDAGLPRQLVMSSYGDPIARHDLSVESDPRGAARRIMIAELSAPLDPVVGPLWVSAILKLSDQCWIWYHRAHHIMLDGFSGGLVVQRVAELYTALLENRSPSPADWQPLATLIEAEKAYRDSPRAAKDRDYWQGRLAGLGEPVTLARPDRRSEGGLLRSTAILPHTLVSRLREQLAGSPVTLPQALVAIIATYYARMADVRDLVFGMPVTARIGATMRRCPGMVANAVPIRLRFDPEATMATLFAQTARTVREALRHQQYRYEDLRRDLGLLRQGQQIARLGINIEPFDYSLTFAGVRAVPDNLSNGQMEDLTVFVYDRMDGGGLRVDLDANPGLYRQDELDLHKQRLRRLFEAVSADPQRRIDDLPLLDDADRVRILRRWNDTTPAAAGEPDPDLVASFRRQAAATPDAPAVLFGDVALTFHELDRRSGALARHLAGQAIGKGDLVALALPRSERLPEVLLAILRSGAAYLPLDPEGPSDRLEMILADAKPAAVVTLRRHADRFDRPGCRCLLLDAFTADEAPEEEDLEPSVDPASTAYVIYTSGSTGRPKGVAILRASLANFLLGMIELLRPGADDRLLSVTTITFDIAAMEMFLPLVTGVRLVIASELAVRDPLVLARLVRSHRITLLQATPTFWRLLLADPAARLDHVHALVGGESLTAELARRMLDRCRRVTNLYGPTETTIWSTAMHLSPDEVDPPPIGRPIRNTRAYVLDQRMEPVPEGVVGMLHVGGTGVAIGYLNRSALTAQSFLPDPFVDAPATLYRTGDLARWRPDGVLEYVGRRDDQIKLHGYRIELGEIEAALISHQEVADAVAAVRPDQRGEPVLVAYVVPASGHEAPDEASLRRHLASRLPAYMLPSLLTPLDAMPLTSSGKTDRNALPAPSWPAADAPHPEQAATRTEQQLVAIWEKVLGRRNIGVHDNFFSVGGDSLSGAQMLIEISLAFSQEVPLDSLFRSSTLAELARLLEQGADGHSLEMLLPLQRQGEKPPLFCIHPITGLGWSYAALMPHVDEGRPLYALQAKGLRHQSPMIDHPQSIEEMAAHYLVEVRQLQPSGPYHLLGWSLGGLVVHAMAAQLRQAGEDVALLALLDSYPFRPKREVDTVDEAAEVRLALDFLGLDHAGDVPAGAPPSTLTELTGFLWSNYRPLSQPLVQSVIRKEKGITARLEGVMRNNLALARRFRPEPVDVDAVFLSASARRTTDLDAVIDYTPSVWQDLVRKLAVYEVDCHHQEILSPEAIGQVGAVLRSHLAPAVAAAGE